MQGRYAIETCPIALVVQRIYFGTRTETTFLFFRAAGKTSKLTSDCLLNQVMLGEKL